MREHLYNQNLWWQNPQAIDEDFKLKQYAEQAFKYSPELIEQFDYSKPGIYTLRGPRQIGKSTTVKLIIRKLLEQKIKPTNIMFYSCEDLSSYQELIELLKLYKETKIESPDLDYIFLDEISFVEDWQRGIKSLYEQGLLQRSFIILTGSNAYDLHHQAERLPGRRGADPYPDKVFLPLSFRDFVKLVEPSIPVPELSLYDLIEKPCELKSLIHYDVYATKLKQLWQVYKLTGGFLTTINDYYSSGSISEGFYQSYLQWIKGDINKLKRSEKTARQVLYELAEQTVNRIDWQSIAKRVDDLGHYSSVVDYVEILESFFITKTLYQIDINTKVPKIKKQKKVYFIDNFIFWTIYTWNEKLSQSFNHAQTKSLDIEPALVESFVAQQLFHLDSQDYLNSRVFFWNGTKEIDFVIFDQCGALFPIEVKYQNHVDAKDFMPATKMNFKSALIVSKNQLELYDDKYMVLPYYLFGLLVV